MKARAVVALLWLMPALHAPAQQPTPAREIPEPHNLTSALLEPVDWIVFDQQRPELQPTRWGFQLAPDGHGRYYAQGSATAVNPSGNTWQDVTASSATMQILLAGARHESNCETKTKHIANTGRKILSYVHGDAWFSCTFNYSDNEAVQRAAQTFMSLAATMEFGERLQREQRFDRLSLDAEIASLEEEIKTGRALEIQNIAPVLRSLAEDTRIIDRVRRKAARMLEGIAPPTAAQENSPR